MAGGGGGALGLVLTTAGGLGFTAETGGAGGLTAVR